MRSRKLMPMRPGADGDFTRLITVGDPAQLPAVGRGGVLANWCATVPHHELFTPRRFDHDWEADASLGLRAGAPWAVDAYDQQAVCLTAAPGFSRPATKDAGRSRVSEAARLGSELRGRERGLGRRRWSGRGRSPRRR